MEPQILEATPSLHDGTVTWQLCNNVKKVCSGPPYPPATLPEGAKGDPPTPFTITINDPNHLGVIFANNPNDPFASQDGNGAIWIQPPPKTNPMHPVFDTAGQIATVTRATDTKIVFKDQNSGSPVRLTYQLNFTMKGSPVTPIDPIIQNGGCCVGVHHPGFLPSTPAAFVIELSIAFIIGILVTVAYERLRR